MSDEPGLLGAEVLDADGAVAGRISALLVTPDGADAAWLELDRAAGGRTAIPADAASADGAGRLVVPYAAAVLAAAPPTEGSVLSAAQAQALLVHYGFPAGGG